MSTVLALDASGKRAGVCVLAGGRVVFARVLEEGFTHSQTLLPLVHEALEAAGLGPGGVNLYAITRGPGSFTGLRIGLALVKGLALPYAVPVAAVSTLRALAAASGLAGTVVSVLNARRGEVYWAGFRCGGAVERLTQDRAGPLETMEEFVHSAHAPLFFVGDGAKMCYNSCTFSRKTALPPADVPLNIALGAALLAPRAKAVSAPEARPAYLRLSQAERERAEKMRAQTELFE